VCVGVGGLAEEFVAMGCAIGRSKCRPFEDPPHGGEQAGMGNEDIAPFENGVPKPMQHIMEKAKGFDELFHSGFFTQ
jgi:hypothetical protein